jgi:aspartate aminotransferase
MPRLSHLASQLKAETAFTVLAMARDLKARGKDVVELEIGDSPFPTPPAARLAGIRAIEANRTGYGPSLGLPEFRAAAARSVNAEFGFEVGPEHIVVASGAKPFEQYFAEALLDPGDGVLIFSPHFPTYEPNLERRGARAVLAPLSVDHGFRPRARDVAHFLETDPRPRAIFLNSPHNPTGGVATRSDLVEIAEVVRGSDLMVFSDEPYCHMVWRGRHESILAQPGMLDHALSAYTFSKSYSMSGWRIGFAVAHPEVAEAIGKLINTTASCTPPFVQWAAQAALEHDAPTRDDYMERFRRKVERLSAGLARIEGINVVPPAGAFYVFPDVRAIATDTVALADRLLSDHKVVVSPGEAFGPGSGGFLRLSYASSDQMLSEGLTRLADGLQAAGRRTARDDATTPPLNPTC